MPFYSEYFFIYSVLGKSNKGTYIWIGQERNATNKKNHNIYNSGWDFLFVFFFL